MLIECQNVSYGYPYAALPVFQHIDLQVADSGFHALFGASGVGKSTLARLLAGQLKAQNGEVRKAPGRTILYSFNFERLPGWGSVAQHFQRVVPAANRKRLDDLVGTFGLHGCLEMRFSQLSLGQKNRVNLTRYLLQEFDLLIMDESLANVDEATREKIILKIKTQFPQKCFLYISHSLVEVAKYAHQIFVLRGLGRTPQTTLLTGHDHRLSTPVPKERLDRVMLELVRAA